MKKRTIDVSNLEFSANEIITVINSIPRINELIAQYLGNNAYYTFENFIGESDIYQKALERAKNASARDGHVMLLGECGVGKAVIAQAIHNSSDRANGPFIVINCASFSQERLISELFGYGKDAYTGDKKVGNIGKFDLAEKGTLFINEIEELPLDLQSILVRVIEQKCFMRNGSHELSRVDVRIISATNKNLTKRIKNDLFRKDLYNRLGTICINIPPLRKDRVIF